VEQPLEIELMIPEKCKENLLRIEEELELQEDLLGDFGEIWDDTADFSYGLVKKEIEKSHQDIEKLITSSMCNILKTIAETNILLLQDALTNYENSVRSQWFSFFRRGRRKKLKLLKPFMEGFVELNPDLLRAKTLEDFHRIISNLSTLINGVTDSADRSGMNTRSFKDLTDEMMHQRHPLLLLQKKYTPETIKKSLSEALPPIDQALEQHCLETKESLTARSITTAKKLLQDSQKNIKAASGESSFHVFSYRLNMAKFEMIGFKTALSRLKDMLQEQIKSLTSKIPRQSLEHKIHTGWTQARILKENLTPARENYERCIEDLITAYQTQVRSQWFSRLRMGRRKVTLLKLYVEQKLKLSDLKTNKLNQGKFQTLIEKIDKISEKLGALTRETEKINRHSVENSSTLPDKTEHAIEQLEGSLKWLDRIGTKADNTEKILGGACKALVSTESDDDVTRVRQEAGTTDPRTARVSGKFSFTHLGNPMDIMGRGPNTSAETAHESKGEDYHPQVAVEVF
jgi:hypothetical protein